MTTMNTVALDEVMDTTVDTGVVSTKSVGGKGMTNFDKLSEDDKAMVKGLVETMLGALSNEDGSVDYDKLVGALDLLTAEKKEAKAEHDAKLKEEKEAKKELDKANGLKVRDILKVGDKVSYLLKSKKIVFEDLTVVKITEKRFHVEIDENTTVLLADGSRVKASSIADLKLGRKYVAFEAILTLNSMSVSEAIAC